MSALDRMRSRVMSRRSARTLGDTYSPITSSVSARAIGENLVRVNGKIVGAQSVEGETGNVLELVNVGRPARAVYAPVNSSGALRLMGGRCGGGGTVVVDNGPGGSGNIDLSLYTPIALFNEHVADDIHHERQHGLLSTQDHTISGQTAGHALVALSATTFGFRELAAGHAMGITFNGNGHTFAVDPTDLDGNGLGVDGSDNLYVKTGDTTKIVGDAVAVNEAYDFDWTGDHSWTGTLGSPSFSSGFAGNGWRLDQGITYSGKNHLELDNLTVRGLLRVYELLATQIRATNGNLFVSDSGKIESVSGSGPFVLTVEGENGEDYQPFAVGDLIRSQRFTGSAGAHQVNMQVTQVNTGGDTRAFTATLVSGDDPQAGFEFVRLGSASDADRRSSIYLAASDTNAPFIDFVDGVDSFADWGTAAVNKMRLGNLDGRTDPVLGVLSGFGMYAENAYLKGAISAADGAILLDSNGINMQAGSSGGTNWGTYTDKFTIAVQPHDLDDTEVVAQFHGRKYDTGLKTTNTFELAAFAGPDYGTDDGQLLLSVREDGAYAGFLNIIAGQQNLMQLYTTGDMQLTADRIRPAAHIIPMGASAYDIGSASYPVRRIYADEIVAGTTSSTDTGHSHDDRYYTESEVDTLLAGKADTSHTHAGYASVAYVDAGLADKAAASHSHDDRYYTESEVDTLLADKASTGHTHADLASLLYVNAQLALKSNTTHNHDGDYYTQAQVDVLIGAIPGAAYYDTLYYRQNAVDQAIADAFDAAAPLSHTHDELYGASLSLRDATGVYATLDRTAFRSADPLYVEGDGGQGLYIGMDGYIEARWVKAVTLSSQVFDVRQVSAVGNTMIIAPAARLHESATMPSAVDGTGIFKLRDPETGPLRIFNVGDRVLLQAAGYSELQTGAAGGYRLSPGNPFMPYGAVADALASGESWLEITSYSRGDGYWAYNYTLKSGTRSIRYPAGTGVVRIGKEGDGLIRLTSDDSYGKTPYIDLSRVTGTPWDGNTPMIRLGRLDGLGAITGGEQWGLGISSDWTDADASQFVASSLGEVRQQNIVSRWTEDGVETVRIDPDYGITLSTSGGDDNRTREIEWYAAGKSVASARLYGRWWLDGDGVNRDQVFMQAQAQRRDSKHRTTARIGASLYDYDDPYYNHNPWVSVTAFDDGENAGSEIDIKADDIALRGSVNIGDGVDTNIDVNGSTTVRGALVVVESEGDPAIFVLKGLPTSSEGLAYGQAWLDNGVFSIYQG